MNSDTTFDPAAIIADMDAEMAAKKQAKPATGMSLADFIDDEESKVYEPDKGMFSIHDEEQANYFIWQYHKLEEEIEQHEKIAKDYLEQKKKLTDEWLEKENSSLEARMEYLKAALREYAQRELEGSKKKSLKLIEGSLSFRKVQPKLSYNDDILRSYLADSGKTEYLKPQKPAVDHAGLKKHFVIDDDKAYLDGQELPGVDVKQADEPAFFVK